MSQRARQARQQLDRRSRQRRTIGVGVLVVFIAGVLLLFGSRLGSDSGSDDGATGAPRSVRVAMTEFAFSPDPIVLRSGDGARLEVVNDGAVPHDLVIVKLGKGTPDLPPGQSMVLDLSNQPAGTYRVVCDLPGHTEAGMVTELTLE